MFYNIGPLCYAQCRILFIIFLNVIMQSVIMQNAIMGNVAEPFSFKQGMAVTLTVGYMWPVKPYYLLRLFNSHYLPEGLN
jgi:hypothetical protein